MKIHGTTNPDQAHRLGRADHYRRLRERLEDRAEAQRIRNEALGHRQREETEMPTSQNKFWMVYGLSMGPPIYRHTSKASAQAEARRLANTFPGTRFVVLATVDAYEIPRREPERVPIVKLPAPDPDDDPVPF